MEPKHTDTDLSALDRFFLRHGRKLVIALALAVLCCAVNWCWQSAARAAHYEKEFTGDLLNVTVTPKGRAYLTYALAALWGAEDRDVTVNFSTFENLHKIEEPGWVALPSLTKEKYSTVDYILMDDLARNKLPMGCGYADPATLLTPAQLALFQGKIISGPENTSACFLDISDTAFARDCVLSNDKVYLAFPAETEKAPRLSAFLDYLLAWGQ